ncbi:MAG: nicotinate phosphoribosyltransferase [Coriobacteriia bacterium]|nr:nicotinate phosphoribosyltransferase [Coriobacteriia bacterium]
MLSAFHTDLYQITMAQARFLLGRDEPRACFSLTFRTLPFEGGFAVCAGLERALEFLDEWHITEDDLTYLRTLKARDGSALFAESFLEHLSMQRFTCDVDAIPEGTIVFACEPLLRITGPVSMCQMVETPLLNIINFSTLIATKAARCVLAADGDEILEFGLRRSQGPDGGLLATRSAYVGGVSATSNVRAGQLYDIPVAGTHAHSWIMSFDSELESFRTYVETSPNNAVLLVDTYDTLTGIRNAITVGREMQQRGQRLFGIRIDSGDLAWLSQQARSMLDEAGLDHVHIVASNSLDEYTVRSLKEQGACVDIWGVGTSMVTGGDQAALDGVYKMTAIQDADGVWGPRMKISDQLSKATLPGIHGVRRFYNGTGMMIGDMVYGTVGTVGSVPFASDGTKGYDPGAQNGTKGTDPTVPTIPLTMVDPADVTRRKGFALGTPYKDLLVPVMRDGKLSGPRPTLNDARRRLAKDMARLDDSHKRFLRPHTYPVGIEESLNDARLSLMSELKGETDE